MIEIDSLRITKLREYLFKIIDNITKNENYQINANMLSNDIDNYSLDKIPTASTVEKWINGTEIKKDVYLFRSRMNYSQDVMVNLNNVGFFEIFEDIINSNNKKGILPKIVGIESISHLNCGTMVDANTNDCEFAIQLQITYKVGGNYANNSE